VKLRTLATTLGFIWAEEEASKCSSSSATKVDSYRKNMFSEIWPLALLEIDPQWAKHHGSTGDSIFSANRCTVAPNALPRISVGQQRSAEEVDLLPAVDAKNDKQHVALKRGWRGRPEFKYMFFR